MLVIFYIYLAGARVKKDGRAQFNTIFPRKLVINSKMISIMVNMWSGRSDRSETLLPFEEIMSIIQHTDRWLNREAALQVSKKVHQRKCFYNFNCSIGPHGGRIVGGVQDQVQGDLPHDGLHGL